MSRITHPIYKDYAEQPYISPERDLAAWEEDPSLFPYDQVAKAQMERLEEGVLPGDIVLLWRIQLNTFTTDSDYPQYFEYRYGINGVESLQLLIDLCFARQCTATESLLSLSIPKLKKILTHEGLPVGGKKADVLQRIVDNIPEEKLAPLFDLRKYETTPRGDDLLSKYAHIIQKHGPKSM